MSKNRIPRKASVSPIIKAGSQEQEYKKAESGNGWWAGRKQACTATGSGSGGCGKVGQGGVQWCMYGRCGSVVSGEIYGRSGTGTWNNERVKKAR